jgi:hypothetical protein
MIRPDYADWDARAALAASRYARPLVRNDVLVPGRFEQCTQGGPPSSVKLIFDSEEQVSKAVAALRDLGITQHPYCCRWRNHFHLTSRDANATSIPVLVAQYRTASLQVRRRRGMTIAKDTLDQARAALIARGRTDIADALDTVHNLLPLAPIGKDGRHNPDGPLREKIREARRLVRKALAAMPPRATPEVLTPINRED